MILHINACARKNSRTLLLSNRLLSALNGNVKEIKLYETSFPVTSEEFLTERDKLVARGEFSAPFFDLAKDFAAADVIVISAPYWDLSFPASLKQYLEQINVPHLTFAYDENGKAKGLCKAKILYYVTTAGGYVNEVFGYGYVKALCETLYGIKETRLIKAEGLDIDGADVDGILSEAKTRIDGLAK